MVNDPGILPVSPKQFLSLNCLTTEKEITWENEFIITSNSQSWHIKAAITITFNVNLILFDMATFHNILLVNLDIFQINHNFNITKSEIMLKYTKAK